MCDCQFCNLHYRIAKGRDEENRESFAVFRSDIKV